MFSEGARVVFSPGLAGLSRDQRTGPSQWEGCQDDSEEWAWPRASTALYSLKGGSCNCLCHKVAFFLFFFFFFPLQPVKNVKAIPDLRLDKERQRLEFSPQARGCRPASDHRLRVPQVGRAL